MTVKHRADNASAVNAVLGHVRQHGSEWFERLDPARTRVAVGNHIHRARCDLYRIDIDDGRNRASVMAKLRHSPAGGPVAAGRPTFTPGTPLSDGELARIEFAGLGMVGATDGDRWVPVRPLALLPEHATVVMDHVLQPPLRRVLTSRARVRMAPPVPADDSCWMAAGAWLRRFHEQRPQGVVLTPRTAEQADLVAVGARFAEHLGRLCGHRAALERVRAAVADLMERHLPAELPLVTGHGDFAPRNVLVAPNGTISVIDPLPRWRVPPYEDLCRFLVNTRCTGAQVASLGMAIGAARLHRYERLFLRGYFGADDVPAALRPYAVLILLDKWSAAVTSVGDPVRRRWFTRYYLREAIRLLDGDGEGGI